jgi:hypothetical protein
MPTQQFLVGLDNWHKTGMLSDPIPMDTFKFLLLKQQCWGLTIVGSTTFRLALGHTYHNIQRIIQGGRSVEIPIGC